MLTDKIIEDLRAALKGGDSLKVSTLRMVLSSIKNKEIEMRGSRTLTDEDVVSVVAKQVKNHQDSITAFEKGNRPDLADKEGWELAVLKSYLPPPPTEDQVKSVIEEVLKDNQEADFGSVMKSVMSALKGQADGSLVARLVREKLGS